MGSLGWKLCNIAVGSKRGRLCAVTALAALLSLLTGLARPATALSPSSPKARHSASLEATTSDAARRDAIKAIPMDKLSDENRVKVESVLSNVSVFRRMPVRVTDCDPDLYLFLVRHPDVVVNIWEVFKISRLKLEETGDSQFRVVETAGATANVEFVYKSNNLHVVYGEGIYQGPLLTRPVKGRGVLVLKAGYAREENGRYYVTSRMDSFLTIEPAAAELATKTMSPLLGRTVDNNFAQTLAFVGSLSRTAEINSRGVQRLGKQLLHVQPEVREQFVELAAAVSEKQADAPERTPSKMASQSTERKTR
jgi:hypothetical protein